jgi:hypothetical protein
MSYQEGQKSRIRQHIRFADFWYAGNGQFTDLKEFTREIAADSGLTLDADQAFQWLGTGGFTNDISLLPTLADVSVEGVKQLTQRFTQTEAGWDLCQFNVLNPNLDGATRAERAIYHAGKVVSVSVLERAGKVLPIHGFYAIALKALEQESRLDAIVELVRKHASGPRDPIPFLFPVLEVWLADGWITASLDQSAPRLSLEVSSSKGAIHDNVDISESEGSC